MLEVVLNLFVGEMWVELFGVMFLEWVEYIEWVWLLICFVMMDDEQCWMRMSEWVEVEIGVEFVILCSEIVQSNELEVFWELKQIFDECLKVMDYLCLMVKVSFWWVVCSINVIQWSVVECLMVEVIGVECVELVWVLDIWYDKIIDYFEFVQSFWVVLECVGC